MKKAIFFFVVALFYMSCNDISNAKNNKKLAENVVPKLSYKEFKEKVAVEKLQYANDMDSLQLYFFDLINASIPDYWLGTPWDFNGTTQTPKEGNIACGYFVTNVLDDLGFEIARVKLAQAPSSKMIKTLTKEESIKRFSSSKELKKYLKKQLKHDIFIVGLDFHTGFIIKEDGTVYFLHSNYINSEGVVKEKFDESEALHSNTYMIGSLSQHTRLLKKWIKN